MQVLAMNLSSVAEDAISEASESASSVDEETYKTAHRRELLARDFFELLDPSGRNVLRASELYHFAYACGFEEGRDLWHSEYKALCQLCNVTDGFYWQDFLELLSNEALPTKCGTSELPSLMERAAQSQLLSRTDASKVPEKEKQGKRLSGLSRGSMRKTKRSEKLRRTIQESQARREAVVRLFYALDADGDGRLKLAEMERFAALCDFSGDWQVEYEVMCEVLKIDAERGADLPDFERLVSNEKSHAYCTDQELQEMVAEMTSRHDQIISNQAAIRIQANTRGFLARQRTALRQVDEIEETEEDELPEPPDREPFFE